ncbi:MAG: hypothetical protein GF313_01515 [Caldithrix sp.]|nr:hypothetical protein [Caldithrix sp.]
MFIKRIVSIVVVAILCSATMGFSNNTEVNWDAFSLNLVKAFKSGHPGLQQSAMQHVIKYGDNLDVSEAIYDIALIFRFNENIQMRRLAMVTLYSIGSDQTISYLCAYKKYLDDPSVYNQCCRMISEYAKNKNLKEPLEITAIH